jgi:hypothetical protein
MARTSGRPEIVIGLIDARSRSITPILPQKTSAKSPANYRLRAPMRAMRRARTVRS